MRALTLVVLFVTGAWAEEPAGSVPSPSPPPAVSASKGDWTTQVTVLSRAPAMLMLATPSNAPPAAELSVGYLLTDRLVLLVNTGLALGGSFQGGDPSWGFALGAGLNILLRKPTDIARPLLLADARFLKLVGIQNDLLALSVRLRVGAEFFLLRWLSLRVATGADGAAAFKSGLFTVGLLPFDVGAAFYF